MRIERNIVLLKRERMCFTYEIRNHKKAKDLTTNVVKRKREEWLVKLTASTQRGVSTMSLLGWRKGSEEKTRGARPRLPGDKSDVGVQIERRPRNEDRRWKERRLRGETRIVRWGEFLLHNYAKSKLWLTKSLWRSLLICEVSFMVPTKTKKIPRRTERDFRTIEPIFRQREPLATRTLVVRKNRFGIWAGRTTSCSREFGELRDFGYAR